MKDIEYIGKSLLIDNSILVVGDLHLGYEGSMRESGYMIPSGLYEQTISDLDLIFNFIEERGMGKGEKGVANNIDAKLGKTKENKVSKRNGGAGMVGDDNLSRGGGVVDKVIILGDLKHEFGKILREEWKEILDFLDYLKKKSKEIIIIKGNHDAVIKSVVKRKKVKVVDYYIWEEFAFLHGDRDFEEIYSKEIKCWVVGHGHPAIVLEEKSGGIKKEKYKCFLSGRYKRKKVIVVPSFFPLWEGTDVKGDFDLGIVWHFNFDKFDVGVVSESDETERSLAVLDFGKLEEL